MIPRGGIAPERPDSADAREFPPTHRPMGIASSPSSLGEEVGRRGPRPPPRARKIPPRTDLWESPPPPAVWGRRSGGEGLSAANAARQGWA
ncbi:MAG: hypothetical protein AVDCRST_MAG68-3911 [uncultured Gemmatimonadetes bacterium]|uniref:Uncharacterized protein n=1 Tax=uncultured Gemmatimonadota bacterium TaxID=203437 RepID=A0A6J4MBE2_9BACT|nr:MAG: hypothetical protein AVDCRST_MAG68-3911 [uncultured Gemmatimonadota bacterium]